MDDTSGIKAAVSLASRAEKMAKRYLIEDIPVFLISNDWECTGIHDTKYEPH